VYNPRRHRVSENILGDVGNVVASVFNGYGQSNSRVNLFTTSPSNTKRQSSKTGFTDPGKVSMRRTGFYDPSSIKMPSIGFSNNTTKKGKQSGFTDPGTIKMPTLNFSTKSKKTSPTAGFGVNPDIINGFL
jgi:hypothetical protein